MTLAMSRSTADSNLLYSCAQLHDPRNHWASENSRLLVGSLGTFGPTQLNLLNPQPFAPQPFASQPSTLCSSINPLLLNPLLLNPLLLNSELVQSVAYPRVTQRQTHLGPLNGEFGERARNPYIRFCFFS